MKILVTGTKGQVSRCLQERAAGREDVEVIAVGRPELDLLKPETIGEIIAAHGPDVVVSAAAYTAVDQAEDEPDIAFAVNEIGASAVAAAARKVGAPVIHMSTDYVFSGELDRPYTEDDAPEPKSVYGASKLAGEYAVAAAHDRHIVLRTAWVYSPYGKNFVITLLKLAEMREEISVVDDQWGNPTSAFDIADAILLISKQLFAKGKPPDYGVFHLAGQRSVSWADFAREIMRTSKKLNGPYANIMPIATADYPTRANRPPNSTLRTNKIESICSLPKSGLERSLQEIVTPLSFQLLANMRAPQ